MHMMNKFHVVNENCHSLEVHVFIDLKRKIFGKIVWNKHKATT